MAAKQPEKVLVLGATGHIGQAVTRRRLSLGSRVTAATRQSAPEALRGLDLRVARVDDELTGLAELAAGHDLIVDAAAPHPLQPTFSNDAIRAAAARTARVLAAVRATGAKFVFVSSFTTLPFRALRNPLYPYFMAKSAMEELVLAEARSGLAAVIVNPAACLGPWEFRAETSSFVGLVLAGRLPVVIRQTLNVIDVRDVAAAIDLALAHECFGQQIPLSGHNATVAELAARITALDSGRQAAPLGVDPLLASGAALFAEAAHAALGQPPPDMWRAVPLMAAGFAMEPSLQQSVIGLAIRPLEETLRDSVAFHRGREFY